MVEEKKDTRQYPAVFLRAVIGNLLRNALHYTNQGQIRLVLEEGGCRVEDSGVSITEAEKAWVFQPFMRGAWQRGEGMGLGAIAGAAHLRPSRMACRTLCPSRRRERFPGCFSGGEGGGGSSSKRLNHFCFVCAQ
ncbi:MAG: hypothetical protein LBU11_02580 [Zoogloeaceae bacterium]|nr:hypothetical protein [Zoogloeaceae bacterium]